MKKVLLVLGVLALILGGILLACGNVMKSKAGNLATAPLVTTGDARAKGAAIGNAIGLVTLSGAVKCAEPILSPVAGTPCLFYTREIKVRWEETSIDNATGKMRTESKSETMLTESHQANFGIDDGSGAIPVIIKDGSGLDLVSSPAASFKDTDAGTIRRFGKLKFRGNSTITESERLLVSAPTFTVHGKLVNGSIGPDNLIISTKPRDVLIAETASSAKGLLVFGWVVAVFGAVMALLGVMMRSSSNTARPPMMSAAR